MNKLDELIITRSCRYGAFEEVAARSARIFHHMICDAPQLRSKEDLSLYYEALRMIALKIARLVNGDIKDLDSWLDIAGYGILVHNHLEEIQASQVIAETKTPLDTHPAIADLDKSINAILEEVK